MAPFYSYFFFVEKKTLEQIFAVMETFASASENKTDNIFLEENSFNTHKATETTYKIFRDYLTEK